MCLLPLGLYHGKVASGTAPFLAKKSVKVPFCFPPGPDQRASQLMCPAKLAEFMDCCLQSDPKKRAKPQELLDHLRGEQKALKKYGWSPALRQKYALDLSGYSQAEKLGWGATADVFRYIKEGSKGVHSKIAIKHYKKPGYDTIQIYIVLFM